MYGSLCTVNVGRHGLRSICRCHTSVPFQSYRDIRNYQFSCGINSKRFHDRRLLANEATDRLPLAPFLSRRLLIIDLKTKTRKRAKNNNDRILPGRYHRAKPPARRLSPHRKSSATHVHALQDAA